MGAGLPEAAAVWRYMSSEGEDKHDLRILLTWVYTDTPPRIRPKMMATMLRMNTGFLRSSGVEKTNSPITIGIRRVGKTVSTTRRFTFAARSF